MSTAFCRIPAHLAERYKGHFADRLYVYWFKGGENRIHKSAIENDNSTFHSTFYFDIKSTQNIYMSDQSDSHHQYGISCGKAYSNIGRDKDAEEYKFFYDLVCMKGGCRKMAVAHKETLKNL